VENPGYSGKSAMYRWYLADPIRFERSLVWTIEHGHDNNYANDYTSVAYWYQIEPHGPFPTLPPVQARLPRFPDLVFRADVARVRYKEKLDQLAKEGADAEAMKRIWGIFNAGSKALLEGRLEEAIAVFETPSGM
jgi:hypothetical protein